jgi:hypothetical protein
MLVKLFYLGAILEPMLFFLILDRTEFGFNISLSRILQLSVITILVVIFGRISNINNVLNKYYQYVIFALFFIIFISFLIGYSNDSYNYYSIYQINKKIFNFTTLSLMLRPLVEILLIVFLYWYYISLGHFFSKKTENIHVLLSIYLALTLLSITLGLVDLFPKLIGHYTTLDISGFLPRHFSEFFHEQGKQYFGLRFNGLYGEPRDAVASLIAFLAILKFIEASDPKNSIRLRWSSYAIIGLCLFLSKSMSGLISIPIFIFLCLIAFLIGIIKLRKNTFLIITIIISTIFFTIYSLIDYYSVLPCCGDDVSRMHYYISTYYDIFNLSLNTFYSVDQLTQLTNFYPLIIQSKLCLVDFSYKCLVGNGIGSSGYVNTFPLKSSYLAFPFSDFVRIFHDIGIIGLILYSTFILAIGKQLIQKNNQHNSQLKYAYYFFILTFASTLSHRSYAIWVVLLFYISFNSILETKKVEVFDKIKKMMLLKYIFKLKD